MESLADSVREPEILRYARIIRRRWRFGLVPLLVIVGLFMALSLVQPASYSASTELAARFVGNDTTFPLAPTASTQTVLNLSSELDFAQGDAVRAAAEAAVGESFDYEVALSPTSSRLIFTVNGSSAEGTAERADAAAAAYIEERRLQNVAGVAGLEDTARTELESARAALETLNQRIATRVQAVEDAETPEEIAAAEDALVEFERETSAGAAAFEAAVVGAESKLALAGPTIAFMGDADNFVRVQTDAASNVVGTSPSLASTLIRALLLGVVVAGAAIFVRDYFDDTVRDENELVLKLEGVPLLGSIPHDPQLAAAVDPTLVGPDTAAGENILSIVNTLEFVQRDTPARSIVLAGMSPGDGRSTIAVNLAVAMARLGRSVVLVDLNVRDPSIHRTFSIENDWGITNCVLANVGLAQLMVPVPALGGLMVLPAGPRPQAPAEMVKSPRTAAVLDALSTHYDHVIVDAPALSEASDVLSIAPHVDGVVLVGRSGSLRRRDLSTLLRKLRQLNVTIVGAIDNATRSTSRAPRLKRSRDAQPMGIGDGVVSAVPGLTATNGSEAALTDVVSTPMPVLETAEQQPITVGVAGNGSAASNGSGSDALHAKPRRSRSRKRSDPTD